MSKKRVHEIAKELKSHGIELDNKEVVTELSSLGYDVKSHSSSLDDDQATAAVQKILDKRKPKQATPPVTAKGFVVRRKVGPPAGATADSGVEASQAAEPAYEPPSAPEPMAAAPAAEEPVHAPPPVEAPRAPVEAPSAPEPQHVEAP
ncbi:translation initiation factor IF-2 N-terminal domain-containing protein, partial [Myxococcus sp. 1LA]